MEKRGGFTLVELMIVIAVIAILATIGIVSYRGIQEKAYFSRSKNELRELSAATVVYYQREGKWPDDVDRDVPSEIHKYLSSSSIAWPKAPWPGSVYDYDNFIGSDGEQVIQVSIRFCPLGGTLASCKFPREPWATGFDIDSSAYWCVTGKCRAHSSKPDSHPGYCMNC